MCCRATLVELQTNLGLFEAAGIRVYGVSHDSPEQLRAFADDTT